MWLTGSSSAARRQVALPPLMVSFCFCYCFDSTNLILRVVLVILLCRCVTLNFYLMNLFWGSIRWLLFFRLNWRIWYRGVYFGQLWNWVESNFYANYFGVDFLWLNFGRGFSIENHNLGTSRVERGTISASINNNVVLGWISGVYHWEILFGYFWKFTSWKRRNQFTISILELVPFLKISLQLSFYYYLLTCGESVYNILNYLFLVTTQN